MITETKNGLKERHGREIEERPLARAEPNLDFVRCLSAANKLAFLFYICYSLSGKSNKADEAFEIRNSGVDFGNCTIKPGFVCFGQTKSDGEKNYSKYESFNARPRQRRHAPIRCCVWGYPRPVKVVSFSKYGLTSDTKRVKLCHPWQYENWAGAFK